MHTTHDNRCNLTTSEAPQTAPGTAPWARWPDAIVYDMSRLMLMVDIDVKWIATKANHLKEYRRFPRDCLRNAEILEDYATQLQTHARQIIRRALENQP